MYEMTHRVRYSEISPNQHINIEQIIKYFQDCSTFDSENIGQGLDYMERIGHIWLLAAWQVEVIQYPSMGDEIVIATWPYEVKGILAYRNFEIRDLKGNSMVKANSIWFYMNMQTGIPKRIEEEDVRAYGYGKKLSMDYQPRKIHLPKQEGEPQESFLVKKADLDTNGHVNNARYIEMAMEYLSWEESVVAMRADYRKSAKYGERIYPVIYKAENELYVELFHEDKEPYVIIEFRIKNREELK